MITAGPYPADKNGNENTNASRAKPYDAVYPDADLNAIRTPVRIGNNSFANGTVVDTRVYTPITDLAPAQTSSSAASNMQHMAVVRDFALPVPAPATERLPPATPQTPGVSDPNATGVTFGIVNPNDYSGPAPDLFTSRFSYGDSQAKGTTGLAAIVSFPYTNNGLSVATYTGINGQKYTQQPVPTTLATVNQVGSVYGLVRQASSNTIYAGAFVRRHVAHGQIQHELDRIKQAVHDAKRTLREVSTRMPQAMRRVA